MIAAHCNFWCVCIWISSNYFTASHVCVCFCSFFSLLLYCMRVSVNTIIISVSQLKISTEFCNPTHFRATNLPFAVVPQFSCDLFSQRFVYSRHNHLSIIYWRWWWIDDVFVRDYSGTVWYIGQCRLHKCYQNYYSSS